MGWLVSRQAAHPSGGPGLAAATPGTGPWRAARGRRSRPAGATGRPAAAARRLPGRTAGRSGAHAAAAASSASGTAPAGPTRQPGAHTCHASRPHSQPRQGTAERQGRPENPAHPAGTGPRAVRLVAEPEPDRLTRPTLVPLSALAAHRGPATLQPRQGHHATRSARGAAESLPGPYQPGPPCRAADPAGNQPGTCTLLAGWPVPRLAVLAVTQRQGGHAGAGKRTRSPPAPPAGPGGAALPRRHAVRRPRGPGLDGRTCAVERARSQRAARHRH